MDINAFAPRDYMKLKKDQRKATINITFDRPNNDNHKGWYNRIENNGWRPISDKILTPFDSVEIETSNKPKKFHFDPKVRKALNAQQKRQRKIRWLRKLYRDAKNAELINEQGDNIAQSVVESTKFHKLLEEQYDNPFDHKKF